MNREDALAQIEEHRREIDAIDQRLVALLNERERHSMDIRHLKPSAGMPLFDPARENAIFSKVCSYNEGPLVNDKLCEIYATLLKVMKENPEA